MPDWWDSTALHVGLHLPAGIDIWVLFLSATVRIPPHMHRDDVK